MNTWLFQANPDRFDIDAYFTAAKSGLWLVRQAHFKDKMRAGDRVYFWRAAGKRRATSGVIAHGWLTETPRVQPPDPIDLAFWRATRPVKALRVRFQLERVAKSTEVIQAKWLVEDPVLSTLKVLVMRNETNYLLKSSQANRLATLSKNTGRDWNKAESFAGLWAYQHTYGANVSRKQGSPVALVAERIGRVVSGVYNKVMNFRALDPRDDREGLSGAGATDRAVWREFYDETRRAIRTQLLDAEFERLWPAGSELEPDAEPLEEIVAVASGRSGQGFISDPVIRKAVEDRAMDLAKAHYEKLFPNRVENTSRTRPYDYRCLSPGGEIRVEVKGSTGAASEIRLTVGEVENARATGWRTDLFLVTGIVVEQTPDGPRAIGGKTRIIEAWSPKPDALFAAVYRYRMPEN